MLASAVYLKAAWSVPFPDDATATLRFTRTAGTAQGLTVRMMRGIAPRAYLRGDGYQAMLLPYRDVSLAMAVVLPDGPLPALRPKVAAAAWAGCSPGRPGAGRAIPAQVPAGSLRSTSSRPCGGWA